MGSSRNVKIFAFPESSFQGFVSVFFVSLRLTSPSANVTVRFSVDDFVVSRFFTEVASCVSVCFSPLLELEAPGVIVVSDGSPCMSSPSNGFSAGSSFSVLQVEEQEGQVSFRRDVQCCATLVDQLLGDST